MAKTSGNIDFTSGTDLGQKRSQNTDFASSTDLGKKQVNILILCRVRI